MLLKSGPWAKFLNQNEFLVFEGAKRIPVTFHTQAAIRKDPHQSEKYPLSTYAKWPTKRSPYATLPS